MAQESYTRYTRPTSDYHYSNDPIGTKQSAVYAIGGTMFVVMVGALAVLLIRKKGRLNWYEQNVLEIASRQPTFVRRKIRRAPTTDSVDTECSYLAPMQPKPIPFNSKLQRRESRVIKQAEITRTKRDPPQKHTSEQNNMDFLTSRFLFAFCSDPLEWRSRSASTGNVAAAAACSTANRGYVEFIVPRHHDHKSMFQNLDLAQFNRELYDGRHDCAASHDEPMLGECGTLNVSLWYDENLSLLSIRLVHARQLISLRHNEPPNPYFRVSLSLPNAAIKAQIQQSKIYKHTVEPDVNDEFFFDVPSNQVDHCKLEVLVYDWDQGSVDDCIGYCWLSLNRIDVSTNHQNPTTFWAEILQVHSGKDNHGELLLSITYLVKAQRLSVNIFKARALIAPPECPDSISPYVRVTLNIGGKRVRRKKTTSKKLSTHPSYNEVVVFNIPKNSLCDIQLEFEVMHDAGAFTGDKHIGHMQLHMHEYKDIWKAMIHGDNTQARWYPLTKPIVAELTNDSLAEEK